MEAATAGPAIHTYVVSLIPMRCWDLAEDVVEEILFLSSPARPSLPDRSYLLMEGMAYLCDMAPVAAHLFY